MIMQSTGEFSPGTEVEVRTHFLSSWAAGFEVAAVVGDLVEIRRRSDGIVLPVAIRADDVRPRAGGEIIVTR